MAIHPSNVGVTTSSTTTLIPSYPASTLHMGDVLFNTQDFQDLKDMIEFMRWVQGSDTELAKQLLAFKTFKKVTEYGHSDDRL